MEFYNTFDTQFELLPRISIYYSKPYDVMIKNKDYEDEKLNIERGISFDWLWFGMFLKF